VDVSAAHIGGTVENKPAAVAKRTDYSCSGRNLSNNSKSGSAADFSGNGSKSSSLNGDGIAEEWMWE